MKHILIINASRNFTKRMVREFDAANVTSERIRSRDSIFIISEPNSIDLFCQNKKIDLENTSVFLRLRGHDSHFASLIAKVCLHKGIPINDLVSAEHTSSNEKVSQTVLLALEGIPTPKSILCTDESFIKNQETILSSMPFPCVLKADGSRGQRVWQIRSLELLNKLLFKYNELFVLQEYIPNTFDIRALVYKNEVLGAIKRSSTDNFYNNVAKGGTVSDIELTDEEKELAIASCKACSIDFGGVDIVRSERGPLVLEVNHGPQIGGFEKHTGMNIPATIASRMIE
ncbi:MAG: ATP-grasp domain-containing protein [Candidatus Campbellbacteria bacterium]|nr:ATP-grasp domain-containing protein [Candidatus Campbellbacteria bacterium]